MRNLINFFLKYNHWLLFFFLELICFILLFRFNNFQGSIFFTSANGVASSVHSFKSSVNSYFGLKAINEQLLDRNTELELKLAAMKSLLDTAQIKDTIRLPEQYKVIKAKVVKNSINLADNYITLNKGSKDGIERDMGVIGPGGVVGIVYMVSEHRSLVISVLNSKSSISSKISKNDYFGNLKWDGKDSKYAILYDLPNHVEFEKGDSIITSGYSSIFPEGIQVGIVEDKKDSHDGLSYIVKVRLSTDFARLNDVRVIKNILAEEQKALENSTKKDK